LLQADMQNEIDAMKEKAANAAEKAAAGAAKAAADAAKAAAETEAIEAAARFDASITLECLLHEKAKAEQEEADEIAAAGARRKVAAEAMDRAEAPAGGLDPVRNLAPTRNYWQF
jgi:hypothetical protein